MKTKLYPQPEEKTIMAADPMMPYGADTSCSSLYQSASYQAGKNKHSKEGNVYTRKDIDEMAEEWLQPLTMEQINRWNEEAEEADETNNVDALIPHEIVIAKMKQFMDSL